MISDRQGFGTGFNDILFGALFIVMVLFVLVLMLINDKKQKTIGGKYQVKMGNSVVSESEFNDGYNSTDIEIPAEILVEAEKLDAKIKEAIIKNFTG